ncbi:MAG TPA: mechanosensitive ion channel family protein [Myxococcota bacterium]|nr:mechanosensitive ion channel family protein [Myxococcota bacterium]
MPHPAVAIAFVVAALSAASASAQADAKGASPRSAMREFLTASRAGDYETAAEYLDLRHIPPRERAAGGEILARRVKALLDRTLWIELDELSDAPEGDLEDGLPRTRESVGKISRDGVNVDVELERGARTGGRPAWRLSSATLSALAPLLERGGFAEEHLPAFWVENRFLEIELWQWLALPLLAVAAWIVARAVVFLLARPLRAFALRALGDDAGFGDAVRTPERLLVGALAFRAGQRALGLAVPVQEAISFATSALGWVAGVWLIARIADLVGARLSGRLVLMGRAGAASLVPLATRAVHVALGAIALLAILQAAGVNVTAVIAGLGVGGLAVALAAQKTVENLFGGVSLVVDQPVRVGDFCRFGDRVGTIEEIGLRSTRIRTLDRTLVTIPNADFSALQLENFAPRDRIWLKVTLGLRYETTPGQLRHVLAALRKLLLDDPRVDPDPARVRLVAFGAYSLDVEIFAYLLTSDINEFHAIREELFLRMMDVVAASGTGFAFPSQTTYNARDAGVDPEKARAAEAEAMRWQSEEHAARASEGSSG